MWDTIFAGALPSQIGVFRNGEMRRFPILLVDILIVILSILLSFKILNGLGILEEYDRNLEAFKTIGIYFVPIYLIIAYIFGMTSLQRKSQSEILYTVFIVNVAMSVSTMALIYISREIGIAFPRSVILLSFFVLYFGLAIWRITIQKLYIKTHGRREAIVIGNEINDILLVLKTKYKNLYKIKYTITEADVNLAEKLEEVEDVFISDDVSLSLRDQLLLLNNQLPKLNLYFIPRVSDISIINARLFPFGDLPIHSVNKLYLRPEERVVKRIVDVSLSILGLIVSLPFFITIAIIIKMDGGTVFFKQERFTRDRKTFWIYKFRTMIPDAEKLTGAVLSSKRDKRITRIGQFLRNTRLDELPQLWNILKGEMSLVGPRPERPIFAEQIEIDIPEFKYRLNVKAGLTGFAQIMGKYNTDFKQKLQYDLYYINNFSIFRDLLIMLQTIKVVFWKENVEGVKPVVQNKTTEETSSML